jgi:hypothetical protein
LKLYDLVTFKTCPDIIGQIVGYQVIGRSKQWLVRYQDQTGITVLPFSGTELELLEDEESSIGFKGDADK